MTAYKLFTGGQPTGSIATVADRTKFLPLKIQFFADGGEGGSGEGDNPDDKSKDPKDPPGDGSGEGDEGNKKTPLDLNTLVAEHPELKAQLDKEKERAVKKRFRNQPDKLKDPKDKGEGDGDGGNGDELKTWQTKAAMLEERAKENALAAAASSEGYNPKLVKALAAKELKKLQLDDDGELDPDDLADVLDTLRTEYPDVFTKTDTTAIDTTTTTVKKGFNPGPSTQRTNQPPDKKSDVKNDIAESLKRLGKHY